MKLHTLRKVAAAIVVLSAATLTGCGKSGSSNSTGTLPPGGGPGGPIQTGACVPISGAIGFQGSNIYFDSANIIGGLIPNSQTQVGQMGVGSGGGSGPYQRQAMDGTITMNVYNSQTQYPGQYPGQNPQYPNQYPTQQPQGPSQVANVSGTLYLSQATQADIMYRFGGQGQYPQPYPTYPGQYPGQYPNQYPQQQQVCVSGIAMNLGHYNTYLYGGAVYLYINGTNRGYVVPF